MLVETVCVYIQEQDGQEALAQTLCATATPPPSSSSSRSSKTAPVPREWGLGLGAY